MLPCKFSVPRVFETLCNIWTKKKRGDDIYSIQTCMELYTKNDEKFWLEEKVIISPCWIQIEMLTHRNGWDETTAEWMNERETGRNFLNLAHSLMSTQFTVMTLETHRKFHIFVIEFAWTCRLMFVFHLFWYSDYRLTLGVVLCSSAMAQMNEWVREIRTILILFILGKLRFKKCARDGFICMY